MTVLRINTSTTVRENYECAIHSRPGKPQGDYATAFETIM